MTEHLSGQRLAGFVCGDATPDERRHVAECPSCAAESARLESALGHFRGGMRAWSDEQSGRVLARLQSVPRRPPAPGWFRWPLLAAAALVLCLAPVYQTVRLNRQAAQAQADAQLLEQVDREVSEAVPGPMEPLAQLVTWGPASQDSSQGNTPSSTPKGEVR
jgi:anti-sigma factor RsiW